MESGACVRDRRSRVQFAGDGVRFRTVARVAGIRVIESRVAFRVAWGSPPQVRRATDDPGVAVAARCILIETSREDYHSRVVAEALRQRGHRVVCLDGREFPGQAEVAYDYADGALDVHLHTRDGDFHGAQFDTVWHRRAQAPTIPACVAAPDRPFVGREASRALRSLAHLLPQAFWVNRPDAARIANLKPWQLREAQRAGLRIARTFIGNAPERVRAFLEAHPGAIYKPLAGEIWEEGGREYATYTAEASLDALPGDALLRAAPGIYQERVTKQYEVRAQFFGATCLAVRIDARRVEYGDFDWRLNQRAGGLETAPIRLPPELHERCVRLLGALGLVAGGFDFIVTPEGDWVFLEVNEAGQFLFLEEWCAELPVLDACCAFLASGDPRFLYAPPARPLHFAAVREHAAGELAPS